MVTEKKPGAMPLDPAALAVGRRFRFVDADGAKGVIRCRFAQPRAVAVTDEPVSANILLADPTSAEYLDRFDVIIIREKEAGKFAERLRTWLAGDSDARQVTVVSTNVGRIRLSGNRAVIQTSVDHVEDLLSGVVEFGFLNAELRRLEQSLLPIQTGAPADVAFAYRIRQSDHRQWDRLGEVMEKLAHLRLAFARLEPRMGSATATLPIESRRAMSGLLHKTRADDRLEAFSDRLEACEDLYEGAVDRITDYRWYRRGNLLEIAIVALLGVEVVLLIAEHFWK
jgi:hypothetical protein